MHEVIKHGVVEANCVGIVCSPSDQYQRFQDLKEKLSDQELLELAKAKDPVLRTYVLIELFQSDKGDIPELFASELQKNEKVERGEGCVFMQESIPFILYAKSRSKMDKKFSEEREGRISEVTQVTDDESVMKKLNRVILYSNGIYIGIYTEMFFQRNRFTIVICQE